MILTYSCSKTMFHFSLLSKIQMIFIISTYTIYTYIIAIYSQVNIVIHAYIYVYIMADL